jgi:photosystem II stability/assembly factor-like uncharacterized protein
VVLRTVNGGSTWSSVGGGAIGTSDIYAIDAINADTAFVTTSTTSTYLYRTTDGGLTWTQVYSLAGGFMDGIHMYNATEGIAVGDPVGGKWVVVKTTNGGATWARIATEPDPVSGEAGWNTSLAAVGTGSSASIWFGTNKNRILRSTDGGATWSAGAVPFVNTYSVWFNDKRFGIAGSSTGVAVRTVDSGSTWIAAPVAAGSGSAFVGGAGAVDFWVARGSNIYRSTDRGATWTAEYTGVGTYQNLSFATFGSSASGWAVTDGGDVSSAYFGAVTGVIDGPPATVPDVFALAQNYPNPFNPSTTIEYSLPQRSNVTLRIYDMLGQEVRTLTTGVTEAGTFKAVWDGRNNLGNTVSTGIYVYRMEATPLDGGNAFASFKKMLLLK